MNISDINKLIYGKNLIQRVTSIEAKEGYCEIFIEDDQGNISVEHIPNRYWILASRPMTQKHHWVRLKGDLHFKWGVQFDDKKEFYKLRNTIIRDKAAVFALYDTKEMTMMNKGITYFKGIKNPKEVSTLSFDIETSGLHHNPDSKIFIISNTFRKNGEIIRKMFTYDQYDNDGEMLEAWCDWVCEIDPSILVGHNVYSFDLPYMEYVAGMYGLQLNLGRDGDPIYINSKRKSKFRVDGSRDQEYPRCRIYGREIIDTMFLAMKYDVGKKYESYGLKSIIKQEGLEIKDRQFYDAGEIRNNYKDPIEWEKIKQYALHDADDALALYDLMIPPFFFMTQSVPKSFQGILESASGSQINSVMCRAYLQDGHSLPKSDEEQKYEGAISIGNPGIYNNVHKVDVASLYPSIMIEYEVFDEDKDPEGYFLTLVKTFTEERLNNKKLYKDTKDKYYDDMQNAQKIFINSCYGFLGTQGLHFNCPTAAEFITAKGREVLQTAMDWATSKSFKIVNGDTDSISYTKEDMSFITEEERANLLSNLNNLYPSKIHFEDDGYFPKVVILKAKNYILFDGKKIKYKGSSLKSATLEPKLKNFLEDIVKILIYKDNNIEDDVKSIYINYIKEIETVADIKPWCSKKTISEKTLESERTNEEKIRTAIQGKEYVEGDKIYTFFMPDESLKLVEDFKGEYCKETLRAKLFKTTSRFETVLPIKNLFLNYTLKKNKKALEELLTI